MCVCMSVYMCVNGHLTVGQLLCKHFISYEGKHAKIRDEMDTVITILVLHD